MKKLNELIKTTARWLDFIIKAFLPVAAVLIVTLKALEIRSFDDEKVVLDLVLMIVAALAISEGLSRFVTLEYIKQKIDALHNYGIPNQKLLEIAHRYGIVGLSPRFSDDGMWVEDIISEIKKCRTTLDLCGIALPSISNIHKLKDAILKHAEDHDVRILLLKPNCTEAERRANIEQPKRGTVADIVDTIAFLKQKIAQNRRIRIHTYTLPPMLGLYVTEFVAYVEPYHFGKPEGIDGCIGGYVPLLKIKNNSDKDVYDNSYAFFKQHFQYLWNDSRGGRENLDITIDDIVNDSYMVLRNGNPFDIMMRDWTLVAQNEPIAYSFKPNFVWKTQQQFKILFSEQSSRPKKDDEDIWAIKYLPSSAVLTLINAKGTTVAQLSPQKEVSVQLEKQ
ncbi:MAG: hypothetical protein D4R73_05715 [Deltaproteobacteria bacterium]|nr:MAG: hypothetical protein D4R73_05715 [Deltaproteobacteria bacterium]